MEDKKHPDNVNLPQNLMVKLSYILEPQKVQNMDLNRFYKTLLDQDLVAFKAKENVYYFSPIEALFPEYVSLYTQGKLN